MPLSGRPLAGLRRALAGALLVAGCALPPETAADLAAGSDAAPGAAVATDPSVRSVQLAPTTDELGLPALVLRGRETLTLGFDVLDTRDARPLEVSFAHVGRDGRSTLLPSEALTGFERDDIIDAQPSGAAAVPYTSYRYTFPNALVDFRISGVFQLTVSERGGRALFTRTFYVTEELAEVDLAFGTTLAGGAVSRLTVQPVARVRPRPALDAFDAFQYTVCFARDGLLAAARCAPEPRLLEAALLLFALPPEAAFPPPTPLFALDLGLLAINDQVLDVDRVARPPTALLDLDQADFGGEVLTAVNAAAPVFEAAYRDVGDVRTDAEYVDVRFRYVPPGGRILARPVYVRGGFNGWADTPEGRMEWLSAEGRYEATLRIKQGRYVYGYTAPPASARAQIVLGQPSLYTALVYVQDLQRFTDRLVAVRSAVAQ